MNFVDSLIDRDGSCRDMNFEAPTWEGVEELLNNFKGSFRSIKGSDQEGQMVLLPLQRYDHKKMSHSGGFISLELSEGIGLLKNIQVFINSESDGSPFVEITFWPGDVKQTSSLRWDFIEWANQMVTLLHARRYFVRYENSSWHFGDTSTDSGVFLSSDNSDRNAE